MRPAGRRPGDLDGRAARSADAAALFTQVAHPRNMYTARTPGSRLTGDSAIAAASSAVGFPRRFRRRQIKRMGIPYGYWPHLRRGGGKAPRRCSNSAERIGIR